METEGKEKEGERVDRWNRGTNGREEREEGERGRGGEERMRGGDMREKRER